MDREDYKSRRQQLKLISTATRETPYAFGTDYANDVVHGRRKAASLPDYAIGQLSELLRPCVRMRLEHTPGFGSMEYAEDPDGAPCEVEMPPADRFRCESYLWRQHRVLQRVSGEVLTVSIGLFSFGEPSFFKPSVAEALSSAFFTVPHDTLARCTHYELITSGLSAKNIIGGSHHWANMVFWGSRSLVDEQRREDEEQRREDMLRVTCTTCRDFAYMPSQSPVRVWQLSSRDIELHHPNCPASKAR